MARGFSKKYGNDITWRSLVEALGNLSEEHGLTVSWEVRPTSFVPFQVRVDCVGRTAKEIAAGAAPRFRARTTLTGANVWQLPAKMYWLVWDIWQQAGNRLALMRADGEDCAALP